MKSRPMKASGSSSNFHRIYYWAIGNEKRSGRRVLGTLTEEKTIIANAIPLGEVEEKN